MKVAFQVAANFGGTGLGYISYQAVRGLHDAGMLAGLTCVSHEQTDIPEHLIRDVRSADALSRMMPRRVANRLGLDALLRQNYFGFVASRSVRTCDAVHGYTGQMLETIHAATRRCVRCVVDRPNTHVRFMQRMLEAEYRKYDVRFAPYRERQVRREARELEMADTVVACSEFARQTMVDEGIDEGKTHVVPYGVDTQLFRPDPRRTEDDRSGGVFRVVFAGLICLRKGIQYLLEAWNQLDLDAAELVLQGHLVDDAAGVVDHYRNRCRFAILPHTENMADLCSLYNSASVCVFPSVEDGFGMVVAEAMACNRPVVVTRHMGAADLVIDGIDGFVVPPADPEAIKERILYLYHHQDSPIGLNARERVRGLTWDAYRAELLSVYEKIGAGR